MIRDSVQFRQLREQLGLTQEAAADLLRVSDRSIRNWEKGTHKVPYVALYVLRTIKEEKSK